MYPYTNTKNTTQARAEEEAVARRQGQSAPTYQDVFKAPAPYVAPQPPKTYASWANPDYSVKTTTPNSSASPTEAYGLNDVEMARYNESKAGSLAPQQSEEELFNNTLRRYQGEIDATNNIFASKLREANTAGLNRSGSQNAQQARAGLLGSDFGNAQDERVNKYNTEISNDIRTEQSLAIASILGKARSGAKDELAAKKLARDTDYAKYKELLTTSSERKSTKTNAYAKELLAKGTTLEELLKLDSTEFSGTGLSKQEVINAFKDAQTNQTKLDLENKKTQAEISKAGQFSLSQGQTQYVTDPVTGITKAVASVAPKPETGLDQKIVKINGVDYVQNSDGSYTEPKVPNLATPKDKVEKAKSLVTSIDAILNNEYLSNATGPASSQIPMMFRSGVRNDVDAAINQLIAGVAIENLALLKGPMSDKDVEFIKQASSGLNTNMSEQGFKDRLTLLKNKFKEIQTKAEQETLNGGQSTGGLSSQEQSTVDQMRKDNPGIPDSVIEQVIGKPLSLGNVGGDTNKALQIAKAIKQVESRGNYNAVGDAGISKGAYQFQPASWSGWSQKYLGQSNLPMTPENQDKVAIARISDLLNQGYNEEQIALIWNGGEPVRKKGFNKKIGLAYDSGAYADKVLKQLS